MNYKFLTRAAIDVSVLLTSIYFFLSYIVTDLYYESATDRYFFPLCLLVSVIAALLLVRGRKRWLAATIGYGADRFTRCFLCYILLLYAIKKILGNMFSISLHELDTPLGAVSGFTLAWRFFGFNWIYDALIAAAQVIIGLLLLSSRTKYLAALLSFFMFGFILSINVFLGIHIIVPVIVFALQSLYILHPVLYSLNAVLIRNKATLPIVAAPGAVSYRWKRAVGILSAGFVILTTLVSLYNENAFRLRFAGKSQFFGGWKAVAGPDSSRLPTLTDKLYIEEANNCILKDNQGKLTYGNLMIDSLNHEISISNNDEKILKGIYETGADTLVVFDGQQQWKFVRFPIPDKGHYADIYSLFGK